MMQDFEKNIREAVESISLSPEDKALMRERLVSYMEHKPIRKASHMRRVTSHAAFPFRYFQSHHLSGALAVALIATVSTFGVTSAAGDALPGDLLYPVKVNINEEIKTVLLSSDEAILTWEKERAEMRLKEASQLASEGRLDTEKQEAVSKLLAEHTEAVAEKIQAVEEKDPLLAAQVSNDLEVSLGTHEAVLARLIVEQEEGGLADEGARTLVEQVRTAAKEVGELREGVEHIIVAEDEGEGDVAEEGGDVLPSDSSVITSVDVTTPKVNSANLRERAAYRAAVNAAQEGEKAREAVAQLEAESELALQAATQIRSGEQSLAEGAQFLSENELGKAYGSFRRASGVFRKVTLLLEALDLFSIEILHETIVEELPDDEGVVGADDTSLTEGDATETLAEDGEEDSTTVRGEAEDKLAQARSMLLTLEGFDEETVVRVNALMRDAMAHLMRGEISIVLGDESGARKLYHIGLTQAERALDLLLRSAATQNVTKVVPPTSSEETSADETVQSLTLQHQYDNGTHVWSGTIETPSACTSLEAGSLVGESFPEQITLLINSTEPTDACATVMGSATFKISVPASEGATVSMVKVNGESRPWSIAE